MIESINYEGFMGWPGTNSLDSGQNLKVPDKIYPRYSMGYLAPNTLGTYLYQNNYPLFI